MSDGKLAEKPMQLNYWTPELDELARSLDDPDRGVSVLEQKVVAISKAAAEAGHWAPIFEAWAMLVQRHEWVTTGEALTVWASPCRKMVDYGGCRPALDFREFEADLFLGVWPELRWGERDAPPGDAPGQREAAWLELWQTLWQAAAAQTTGGVPETELASLIAFSRLAATVFAPRHGDEALGMPARWRLNLLKQVHAFEAAAVGAPGGEALARPDRGDAEAGKAIAAGCCTLFHHADRSLGSTAGQRGDFSGALDDLIATPPPTTEAPGPAWPERARRILERLFRFWAAGDAVVRALLETALGLDWSDAHVALPAPKAPEPRDVFERIALIGGSNVGKTAFLFGSEHLRRIAGDDDRFPVIEHAWKKDVAADEFIAKERKRWEKGMPSNTQLHELIATTGIHSFQAFEIVDMNGESLLPPEDAAAEHAMRDVFEYRPPAALVVMLDLDAPLSNRDVESSKRLVTRAQASHCPKPPEVSRTAEPPAPPVHVIGNKADKFTVSLRKVLSKTQASHCSKSPEVSRPAEPPVPPVHLLANKVDKFIVSLREVLLKAAAESQEADAALLDALCEKAFDLGVLMRRAARVRPNPDCKILPFVMREALEAEELSANPTLGSVVDQLLESKGELLEMLMTTGATNVVLNFTCSLAPGGVPGLALNGISSFWNEIWGWAEHRRCQALGVQRHAFVDQPEKDQDTVNKLLSTEKLRFGDKDILEVYDAVVTQARESAKSLSARIETGDLPPGAERFAGWLRRSSDSSLKRLADAVESAENVAEGAKNELTKAVDDTIGNLIMLLGIDPDTSIDKIIKRPEGNRNIFGDQRAWLDEKQCIVADKNPARSRPALIASDKLPEWLVQAAKLIENIQVDQRDDGFCFLQEMVKAQTGAIRPEAELKNARPGGPDTNPRLFHRSYGALLDDCFWRNESWDEVAPTNRSVTLLEQEAMRKDQARTVKALLIGPREEQDPNPNDPSDWQNTLAPMLRLLAECQPKFPQLTVKLHDSDAVKIAVLDQLPTRRRVEGLIAALEASLAVRATLHEPPGIAARVRKLTMIEALLPAFDKLGFDATAFDDLVRHGTPDQRGLAIRADEGELGLQTIRTTLGDQVGRWPRGLRSMLQNNAQVIQPIRTKVDDLRIQLIGRFGSHILPERNQVGRKSLDRAVTRLQAGVELLAASAGEARQDQAALSAEMQDLGRKIDRMRGAVNEVRETIREDILVERYRRFLRLNLEESAQTIAELNDGLGLIDGGAVLPAVNLDELEIRHKNAIVTYFNRWAGP